MNTNVMRFFIILIIASGLTACASTPPAATAVPPLRDADLYPNAQSKAGLTIAVDEISDPDRVSRYFGVDLTNEDILPVNIVATNRSEDPFLVKPADVLLLFGDSVVDTVPPEAVDKTARERMAEFGFQEMTVPPGGSYQGVLLFRTKRTGPDPYGRMEKIFFLSNRFSLRIAATDRTTGERIMFGPFPISGL